MKSILKFSSLVLLLWQAVAVHAALTVTNIAAGDSHSLFLKSDGTLWGMGYDNLGQLGDGTYNFATNHQEQIAISNVVSIAVGNSHTLLLKSDGSLWAMGYNFYGQLGDGTYTMTNRPKQIIASDVTAIAAGYSHSLFLKSDGSLWGMGANGDGQLADGTYNSRTNLPEQIVSSGVAAIAGGGSHTLLIKTDGSLWAVGQSRLGQLGYGPPAVHTNQLQLIVASGVAAVAGGNSHSLFLKSDGSLWVMGNNNSGQLGDGTANSQTNLPEQIVTNGVSAIACGNSYSLFLKTDGSLWAMGKNLNGQFPGDNGTFISTNRPQQIVSNGVTAIAAGGFHALFLKTDGSLWVIGHNYWGQFGDGFTVSTGNGSPIPLQIIPQPSPVLTNSISAKTNLQLTAAGQFGGNYVLLEGTNFAQPFSQWKPIVTNIINSRPKNLFATKITNIVNPATVQKFYILQSP